MHVIMCLIYLIWHAKRELPSYAIISTSILWCRPNILWQNECYDVAEFSRPAVIFPRAIYNSCSQCWLSLPHKFPAAPLFSDFCLHLSSSERSVVMANLGFEQRLKITRLHDVCTWAEIFTVNQLNGELDHDMLDIPSKYSQCILMVT